METDGFEEWCILELMGHRRLGGLVTEAVVGGIPFLRIDVPCKPPVTQYYGKAAVYAMTPTTEDVATRLAQSFAGPVQRYELPAAPESHAPEPWNDEDEDSEPEGDDPEEGDDYPDMGTEGHPGDFQ